MVAHYDSTANESIRPRCPLWVISGHCGGQLYIRFTPKSGHDPDYTATRSINVGSSSAAHELFTLRDTGHICK
jgi:hypothetical protein